MCIQVLGPWPVLKIELIDPNDRLSMPWIEEQLFTHQSTLVAAFLE